ncbi:hypothetical protein G9H65_02275 [Cytophagaceae bacterium 50A-KIRBA]|uniref:hypothetical protein n=1 Tax=Aquirufa ecclesiirivi TaxID=2715124 RepID=UPI00140C9A2B|nr:hypothetical protein [Aquirufa ecclesiirivi]NHC48149.1 hypothetical protein [Aquirufa ecclesiirivi]
MDFLYNYFKVKLVIRNILRDIFYFIKGHDIENQDSLRNYIKWNENYFKKKEINIDSYVFVDLFSVPSWLFINSFAVNKLTTYFNCSATTFSHKSRNHIESKLFNSFNVDKHFKVSLCTSILTNEHKKLYLSLRETLKSKKDLLELEINGIKIGVDIYESILRTGLPTVDINSKLTWEYIYLGLLYMIYFEDLCKRDLIKAFVLSHDNYIYMGLPAKIGYKYGIPVYLFNAFGFYKLERFNHLNIRWALLPELFNSLPKETRKEGISWAESQLNLRLGGVVGVDMSYQLKSAFELNICESQILNNGNLDVVVATHEFYDNPHGYGNLLFNDFYDWLMYLGKKSNECGWNLYLKAHRDSPIEEINELKKFTSYFANIILLNQDYSFHQLKDEGVNIVLTCFGTVGHELPLLGFKVINAGVNPHIGYRFNLNPKSFFEYDNVLSNLKDLKIHFNRSEIFEFYYGYKKILFPFNFELDYYCNEETKEYDIFNKYLSCADRLSCDLEHEIDRFIVSNVNFSFQNYM